MRRAVWASLVLHAIVVFLFAVGIGDPFQQTLKNQQPLLVDFVQIAETSAAPKLSPQQKLEAPKPEPKPEPTPPELETPSEPKTQDPFEPERIEDQAKTPKAEKEVLKPEEAPQDPAAPDTAPILKKEPKKENIEKKLKEKKPKPQKPEPKKSDLKKPEAKKEPKKADKKPTKAEINLKKNKSSSQSDKKPDPKAKKKPSSALNDLLKDVSKDDEANEGEDGAPAQSVGPVVTASEIDALRQHIRKCWVVPAGIKGAKDMTVDIKMEISKDGTVLKAHVVNKSRMAQDGAFRTAAESAQRAVLDPQCNPLPLPKGKYEQWKDLEFSFNPKDMY